MKVTAKDLLEMGIVDDVIEEPMPASEANLVELSNDMKNRIRVSRGNLEKNRKCWTKNDMPGSVNFKILFICVKRQTETNSNKDMKNFLCPLHRLSPTASANSAAKTAASDTLTRSG